MCVSDPFASMGTAFQVYAASSKPLVSDFARGNPGSWLALSRGGRQVMFRTPVLRPHENAPGTVGLLPLTSSNHAIESRANNP